MVRVFLLLPNVLQIRVCDPQFKNLGFGAGGYSLGDRMFAWYA